MYNASRIWTYFTCVISRICHRISSHSFSISSRTNQTFDFSLCTHMQKQDSLSLISKMKMQKLKSVKWSRFKMCLRFRSRLWRIHLAATITEISSRSIINENQKIWWLVQRIRRAKLCSMSSSCFCRTISAKKHIICHIFQQFKNSKSHS